MAYFVFVLLVLARLCPGEADLCHRELEVPSNENPHAFFHCCGFCTGPISSEKCNDGHGNLYYTHTYHCNFNKISKVVVSESSIDSTRATILGMSIGAFVGIILIIVPIVVCCKKFDRHKAGKVIQTSNCPANNSTDTRSTRANPQNNGSIQLQVHSV